MTERIIETETVTTDGAEVALPAHGRRVPERLRDELRGTANRSTRLRARWLDGRAEGPERGQASQPTSGSPWR
jgi:hypothetical protein